MIKSAVIAAAGRGTRLMPSTKEQPKEMLPIVDQGKIKPILNLIVEQIHDAGISKMFVITGRDKRAIEDHFTQNYGILEHITDKEALDSTESFYNFLGKIKLSYINQPRPDGFGAAAHLAKEYVGHEDSFYFTSGDSIVYSLSKGPSNDFITRLKDAHEKHGADATLAVFETDTPQRYGVVLGDEDENGVLHLNRVVEKPQETVSNLAICGKYIFKPTIFHALEKVGAGLKGEKQITDAIEWLIEKGYKVIAIKLRPDEIYMDIGNPKTYVEAFITTSLFDSKLNEFTKNKVEHLTEFYKNNTKRE
ncbi:MAG: NTP transferase domain-containing protein [Candidatus Aenigmarchaeota archaeon]|nr:NTP transferase domain-containing protein [Candidatus Aenigmarchaeota archaeon]